MTTDERHLTSSEQKVMDRALRASVNIIDSTAAMAQRLEHAERCLKTAIHQIKVDTELLYEGCSA